MENTTQLFLGVRFNCNKCHDHPFERWTQDQYYQLAAFFAQVRLSRGPEVQGPEASAARAVEGAKPLVEIIADAKAGEVKHERTGQMTPPEFPYDARPTLPKADRRRREQLAKWITSPENQYFAKSYVNRLWSYLLGVGLIEPIDDIRAGNPPTNPKLLDRLTEEFVASELRRAAADARRSASRGRISSRSPRTSGTRTTRSTTRTPSPRRLPAEVLYDAIHRATGLDEKLPGLPPGARAAQLLDSNVELPGGFLDLFGKPPRESACECERVERRACSGRCWRWSTARSSATPSATRTTASPSSSTAEKDDAKVVEEIYLRPEPHADGEGAARPG